MDRIWGLTYYSLLADAGDFFELLGPLLLFGIYAIAALAKKWAGSRQPDTEEKEPSELQKAVRKRYQQIYQRQTGQQPEKIQSPKCTEPVKPVPVAQPVKAPAFVRQPQPTQKTYPAPHVRAESQQRVAKQQDYHRQNRRPKPVSPKAQTPKPVRKSQTVKRIKAKTVTRTGAEHSLKSMIRQRQNLRTAIILKEILDSPLGLKDF